jgi:hypothetical protein
MGSKKKTLIFASERARLAYHKQYGVTNGTIKGFLYLIEYLRLVSQGEKENRVSI